MATLYEGFLTDGNSQNPHAFVYGVPSDATGNKAYAWFDGPAGATLMEMGLDLIDHYATNPNIEPPKINNNCTLIFRYLHGNVAYGSINRGGYADFVTYGGGTSGFSVLDGETKIFWFCKSTIQIGATTTRNIVFTRNSNGILIAYFRVGTTNKFTVNDNAFPIWSAPWIYPYIRYNASVVGCAGGWEVYYSISNIDNPPATTHFQIPNGFALPSYYDTAWSDAMQEWLDGLPEPIDQDNPYNPGGTSEPGGGNGNFSEDSDSVEEDSMPTLDAIGTGMATIFSPSKSQLRSLSDVFWGSQWWTALQNTIEGIDKMFVSLGVVPFNVSKGSTVEVTWLGLAITEVMLTLASQQYYEFDMGTIDLSNDNRIFTSGSALDYSPFSKIGIYLPFIGYEELDIDEVRGATVSLKYRIDILSGTCVALVKVNGNTIYQFTGNCITQIPITSQNFENMFTNAVNVGISLVTAKTGAAAASAGAEAALDKAASSEVGLAQHEAIGAVKAAKVNSAHSSLAAATANAMMGMKPTFNKTGAVSASASAFAVKQPFLYLVTPRQCIPTHYQRYCGFPSNMTGKLSEFSGYTVVEDIRLNGLVATSSEVGEIYDLLKSGVII